MHISKGKREYEAEKASSEYGDDFYEYATAENFAIYTIMKMTRTSRIYYYTVGVQAICDDIIHVDCDGNDSEAVKELEKLCSMYDFYTDGALCCHQLDKKKEFLENLKKACDEEADEVRNVLGFLFPKELDVNEYYNYMYNKLK